MSAIHFSGLSYDLLSEVVADLANDIAYAESYGIPRTRLIIDPGIGGGKSPEQNLIVLRNLERMQTLELPILIAASRKSVIVYVLRVPPDQRDWGTAAVTALAIRSGVDVLRVHNVLLNNHVARMADALVRAK